MLQLTPKILSVLLAICLIGGCVKEYVYLDGNGNVVSDPNRSANVTVTNFAASKDQPSTYIGKWSAPVNALDRGASNFRISMTTDDGAKHSTQTWWFNDDVVVGLPLKSTQEGATVQFSMHRQAGTIQFTGSVKGTVASGDVSLAMDGNYHDQIQQRTATKIDPLHALQLFAWDMKLEYVAAFHDAGYRFNLDDMFELRRMSVEPGWAAELKQAQYEFSADELTELRRMSVPSKYARVLREGGLTLKADELVELRRMGVDAPYAIKMHASGVAKDVDSIIELHRMGVDAAFVTAIRDAGYRFDVDQILSIRRMGVQADWARKLKQAGYDFDADDLVELRRMGVEADYAIALVVAGRKNLSADDIVSLRRRGIDAETAAKLRQ